MTIHEHVLPLGAVILAAAGKSAYQIHTGKRRGQWPTSLEISVAMFEYYGI
ncbi:MAG: hypothetical protein HQL60_03590 [Magnetococcales bacterium]|nr:hypothetical protein [Magnetococcales bacterium]